MRWPEDLREARWALGLSGGADSVALLRRCVEAGGRPVALHFNHGFADENGDEAEAFCRDLCATLGVPLRVGRCPDPEAGGGSKETRARRARMAFLAEAARCCDAAPADITGTGRHARLVMARQAAMYVCRRHLGLSYPELGRAFGGRDHSTVIHAVKKIGKMLESNKDVQHLVARLEKCAHQEQPDSSPTDEVFGA